MSTLLVIISMGYKIKIEPEVKLVFAVKVLVLLYRASVHWFV
jgi:hypothetical protein